MLAAAAGFNDLAARYFIHHGATIDQTNFGGSVGTTALIRAAALGNTDMVKILLGLGANKDHKNIYDADAIYFAKQYGHLDTVQVLENWGK